MLDEEDGRHLRNTHEWVNRDSGPAMSSWPLHDYERDPPSLTPLLQARDCVAAHAKDLPPDLERTLRKQGVDSVLLVPLLRDGRRIGLTGCDSCGKKRLWSEEEVLLLRHLAMRPRSPWNGGNAAPCATGACPRGAGGRRKRAVGTA